MEVEVEGGVGGDAAGEKNIFIYCAVSFMHRLRSGQTKTNVAMILQRPCGQKMRARIFPSRSLPSCVLFLCERILLSTYEYILLASSMCNDEIRYLDIICMCIEERC